jgi:two-component system nitrogen regulation response regulator GlnG
MELLRRHHWPGNVRELQSAVKHALLEATGPVLVPAFLPASIRGETSERASASAVLSADSLLVQMTQERLKAGSTEIYAELIGLVERQVISEVLRHAEGNLTQAARHLGITRNTLRSKLTSLGIAVDRTISVDETGTPDE